MSFWTEEDLKKIHSQAYRCKEQLKKSDKVGCFYCGSIFRYRLLNNFMATKDTALCPICGIDAVIPLADIPEAEYASLLEQMYEKYFAGQGVKLSDLMKKHLYLFQQPGRFLDDLLGEIEETLIKSKRKMKKQVYSYYEYTVSYSIPIYDDKITIYPLERQFIDWIVPEFYRTDDFSKDSLKILQYIVDQGPDISSCIIELPGILKEREAEHVVKLLGMAFGGYFTHVNDLPADGRLTKQDHIYIPKYPKEDYDIINNLEKLLEENS